MPGWAGYQADRFSRTLSIKGYILMMKCSSAGAEQGAGPPGAILFPLTESVKYGYEEK